MATNGKLPASSLGFIKGTSRQVLLALVPQTDALRAAFERKFHKPLTITGGYRSYASQVSLFRDRYTTTVTGIDPRWWNGTLYWRRPGTAAAAVPGTSNHGWGQAIDFGAGVNTSLRSDEYWWMRNNAPSYGWSHPLWAREAVTLEPWHWEALPTPVNFPGSNDNDVDIPIPDLDLPDDLEKQMTDAILERIATVRSGQGVHDAKLDTLLDYARKAHVTRAAHTQTLAVIKAAVTGSPAPVVDEAALAHALAVELAPAVTAAVLNALPAPDGLTPDEHRALAEQAIRNVLGSLDAP